MYRRTFFSWALFATLTAVGPATEAATIAVSPNVGPPTSITRISGSGFGTGEAVNLYFDNVKVGQGFVNASGALSNFSLKIPATALPEQHQIKGTGQISAVSATTPFWVHTDWPQVRATPGLTNANAYENVLKLSNVAGLKLAWSQPVPGATISSGAVVVVANGRVYTKAGGRLSAFRTVSGAPQWSIPVGSGLTAPAVAWIGAPVSSYFAYAGYASGVAAYKQDGTLLWKKQPGGSNWMVVSVVGGVIHAVQGNTCGPNGSAYCKLFGLRATDGAVLWQKTFDKGLIKRPAVANNIIYTIEDEYANQHVSAYRATDRAFLWSQPASLWWNSVMVSQGKLFAGDAVAGLFAHHATNGSFLWESSFGSGTGECALDSQTAYCLSGLMNPHGDLGVIATRLTDGAYLWSYGVGQQESVPVVANGVVYVVSGDFYGYPEPLPRVLHAFSAATGTELFEYPLTAAAAGDVAVSNPIVADGKVYVAVGNVLRVFGL